MDLQSSQSPAEYNLFNAQFSTFRYIVYNFTYHCISNSTLAYFEPPNYWNNHQVQDVVDLGAKDTHHLTGSNTEASQGNLTYHITSSGPFLASINAIFGKNTFFDNIAKANDTSDTNLEICEAFRMALTGLCTSTGLESMCNPYQDSSSSPGPVIDCITRGGDDSSNPNTDHQHPDGTFAIKDSTTWTPPPQPSL